MPPGACISRLCFRFSGGLETGSGPAPDSDGSEPPRLDPDPDGVVYQQERAHDELHWLALDHAPGGVAGTTVIQLRHFGIRATASARPVVGSNDPFRYPTAI